MRRFRRGRKRRRRRRRKKKRNTGTSLPFPSLLSSCLVCFASIPFCNIQDEASFIPLPWEYYVVAGTAMADISSLMAFVLLFPLFFLPFSSTFITTWCGVQVRHYYDFQIIYWGGYRYLRAREAPGTVGRLVAMKGKSKIHPHHNT